MTHQDPRKQTLRTSLCLLITTSFLSACATDADRTRTEGASVGAILGGALGAAVGRNAPSAAAGVAVGGLAGLGVGQHVAKEKADLAAREDALSQSADRAHQLAQQTRQQNEQTSADLTRLQQNVQLLTSQQMTEQERRQQLQIDQRQARILMSGVNLRLQRVETELSHQRAVLADAHRSGQSPDGIRLVSGGIHDLESNEHILEYARAQLQLIDSRRAY